MTIRSGAPHRRVLVMLGAACLLWATSCSSGSDSANANIVPIDAADVTANATTAPAGSTSAGSTSAGSTSAGSTSPDGSLATPDSPEVLDGFYDVTQSYDSFLELRAQAITREIELDALEPVATAAAIEQVLQLRTANDDLIDDDSYAALSRLQEWSNVSAIDDTGERVLFTDCTERHYQTPAGTTVVRFVTNDVQIVDDDGQFKVDAVTMTQDGVVTLEPETFGCAPPSFINRAETTARAAVETAAALTADPQASLDTGLPALFVDGARADLEQVLQSLATQGLARTADETVTYEVLGLDVNRPEFTVVVAVCRTYPNGRFFTTADGEPTVTDLPTGSSYEEWVYVNLEAVPSGSQTADAASEIADRGPNCQKG